MKAAAKMPPLPHWSHQGFDVMRSEVCKWLIAQPELRQELFNWAKRHGVITFDTETHCWRGVQWPNDTA
jgi:hypothetical protein